MGGGVECPELSRRGGVSVRGDHGSEGAAPWPRDPAGRVAWCPLREVTPQPWVMGHRGMPLASFPRGPSIPAPLSATCGREEIGLARFGTPTGFGTRSSACITWPGTRARFPEPVSRAYPREAGIYPVARGSRAGMWGAALPLSPAPVGPYWGWAGLGASALLSGLGARGCSTSGGDVRAPVLCVCRDFWGEPLGFCLPQGPPA